MHRTRRVATCALAMAVGACSHLEAKKVPLADRHSGADKHVDGFRYYQPRPYIVVAERVPIAENRKLGFLVQPTNKATAEKYPYLIAVCDKSGAPTRTFYDLSGNAIELGSGGVEALPAPSMDLLRTGAQNQVGPELIQRLNALEEQLKKLPKAIAAEISTKLTDTQPTETQQTPKPDSFQVVMLPDFEEQMAVKDKNCLAGSEYQLNFQDGWGLVGVSGKWDSTQVPIRILQTLGTAIGAYADVQKKALLTLPVTREEIENAKKNGINARDGGEKRQFFLITESHFIPPGMYRLQKPSEGGAMQGAGLLSELGIPTRADTKVQLVVSE